MEVGLLGPHPRGLGRRLEVFAVQGQNAATELAAAALLAEAQPAAQPLLPSLLGRPRGSPKAAAAQEAAPAVPKVPPERRLHCCRFTAGANPQARVLNSALPSRLLT